MQYLVEGARGPLPASPEQAVALLEGTVIPHFEHVIRLKAEGKILAGGEGNTAAKRRGSRRDGAENRADGPPADRRAHRRAAAGSSGGEAGGIVR